MATVDSLPPAVRDLLHATLRPGEAVRWVAQPDVARAWADPVARRNRIVMRVLLWLIIFITLMMLIAAPIIGLEAMLLTVPAVWFLRRIAPRRKAALLASACVVTDQRALNLCATRRLKVESFEPADIPRLGCKVDADGGGSIVFFTTTQVMRHGTDTRETYVTTDHGFLFIPDVREAERYLQAIVPPPLPA